MYHQKQAAPYSITAALDDLHARRHTDVVSPASPAPHSITVALDDLHARITVLEEQLKLLPSYLEGVMIPTAIGGANREEEVDTPGLSRLARRVYEASGRVSILSRMVAGLTASLEGAL